MPTHDAGSFKRFAAAVAKALVGQEDQVQLVWCSRKEMAGLGGDDCGTQELERDPGKLYVQGAKLLLGSWSDLLAVGMGPDQAHGVAVHSLSM